MPGAYKVEVTLTGEDGKEFARKVTSFIVKGDALAKAAKLPASPADSKHSDDADKDDDN